MSSFPGILYGQLFYRHLEWDKIEALGSHNNDYDTSMGLSQEARKDLTWWIENIESKEAFRSLTYSQPDITISSDASQIGWGAECNGITHQFIRTLGWLGFKVIYCPTTNG